MMRNIILTVTIVVGACASLGLLTWLLLELLLTTGLIEWLPGSLPNLINAKDVPTIAWTATTIPSMLMTRVYDLLEASSTKRALAKTGLSVNEFSIHPLFAFLLCLITWSGIVLFTGALMGMLVGMSQSEINISKPMAFTSLVVFTALPLRVIAAAYLGCWIGTRSRRYVLGIVIGCIVLGYSAGFLLSISTMSSDLRKAIFNDNTALEQFISILPDIVIFIISGALGFWYGQRQKPAYYLAFIVRMLPQETRQAIVEMAQDEAKRAAALAMQASS
jgi:hypothetical protein